MYLLYDGIILTMDREERVLHDSAVVIEGNKIEEIGSGRELLRKYAAMPGCEKISCEGKAILPGFVNTHIHSAQSIVRGMAEDLGRAPSYTPTVPQGDELSDEESYVFALLGAATAMRFGSTTVSDNYAHAMVNAEAFEQIGIRAVVSERVHDMIFPLLAQGKYEKDAKLGEDLLQKNVDVLEKYSDPNGLITACLGPHAPDTCSRELLRETAKLYEQYKAPVTTHLAQSQMELARVREQYGVSSTELLEECGLLNPHLMAAHGVFLTEENINRLAEHSVQMVHIPEGNAKAGSIARIKLMRDKGINVSIGTDNGAANMIENMRMALVCGRILDQSVTCPSSKDILKLSTINGAKALHMEDKIGSIEEGKLADLILVDLDRLHMTPCIDVVGNLVHLGLGNDVETVFVNGKITVQNGKVLGIDEKHLMKSARRIAEQKWLKSNGNIPKQYIYTF